MNHFSNALELALKAKGMNGSQLASAMGASTGIVSRYLAGAVRPTPDSLSKLCVALGPADAVDVVIGHLRDETPDVVREFIGILPMDSRVREEERLPNDLEAAFTRLQRRASHDPSFAEFMIQTAAFMT